MLYNIEDKVWHSEVVRTDINRYIFQQSFQANTRNMAGDQESDLSSPTRRDQGADIEKQAPHQESVLSSEHAPQEHVVADKLARKLTARQVQMIAIGGTIGTGLFLGTGKSLATGGPASMLIAYAIVGGIVFVTMLSLAEMAAFIPIAGSFCTYAGCVLFYFHITSSLVVYRVQPFPLRPLHICLPS